MTVYNKNNFEFMEHFLRINIPFEQGYANDYTELNKKSSEKIINLIKQNNKLSASEIAGMLGISARAVEKQISQLKKVNKLKRVGADKGGHWEIL